MKQGKDRRRRVGEAGIVKPSNGFRVKSEDMERSLEDTCANIVFWCLRKADIANLDCQPNRI